MKENLIDEHLFQICPILTGGGRSLFAEQINISNLKLLEVRLCNTGTVILNQPACK